MDRLSKKLDDSEVKKQGKQMASEMYQGYVKMMI